MRNCKKCKHLVMFDYKNRSCSCESRECEFDPEEQEPKTGHWIYVGEENKEKTKAGNFRYVCSECGFTDVHGKSIYVPYCWQCGVKMAESEGKE